MEEAAIKEKCVHCDSEVLEEEAISSWIFLDLPNGYLSKKCDYHPITTDVMTFCGIPCLAKETDQWYTAYAEAFYDRTVRQKA